MEISSDSGVKKAKRLTSVVWNYFERVRKADTCYAVCVHCSKKLSGSSNSGTTHLRNHLMRCLKRSNYDVSQLLSAKRRKKETSITVAPPSYEENQRNDEYIKPTIVKFDSKPRKDDMISLASSRFDQGRSTFDLARMIILHGYPLSMPEQIGFKMFAKNLQPLFDVSPLSSIESSCLEIYAEEKVKMFETLNKLHGRVNIAVDTWRSIEFSEFLCLTAHYIDDTWKLQSKILNLVTVDSGQTRDTLVDTIMKCLIQWNIETKLFAITSDEEDETVFKIKERITQSRALCGNVILFDVISASHTLNSIVEDAIEALRSVSQKVRESIRYVKSTQAAFLRFEECAHQTGVSILKPLKVDFSNKWRTTYAMLDAALEFKPAFCHLAELDGNFTCPTETEWDWVSSVTAYLKLFVEITEVFSSMKNPTANMYFPEICDVHIHLIEWCKSPDVFLNSLATKMKERFDVYWSRCNLSLAISAILDPRFKMKLVEYYYSQIYGSNALERIKEVSDGLKDVFNGYFVCSTMEDEGTGVHGGGVPVGGDRLKGFDKFLHETSHSHCVSDLDKYLDEPVFPRNCDFQILNWWKVHTPRYPVLSMMARDVLGTPMSSSPRDRVLDGCRGSLSAETREALICARDWLKVDFEDHASCSSIQYPETC